MNFIARIFFLIIHRGDARGVDKDCPRLIVRSIKPRCSLVSRSVYNNLAVHASLTNLSSLFLLFFLSSFLSLSPNRITHSSISVDYAVYDIHIREATLNYDPAR